jgi:hypothetical protein
MPFVFGRRKRPCVSCSGKHDEEYRQRRKANRRGSNLQWNNPAVRLFAACQTCHVVPRVSVPTRIASGRQVPECALGVCRPYSTGKTNRTPSAELLVGQSPVWILDRANLSNRPQETLAFVYGCPPCVRIIRGIATTAAAVISVRKTTPRKVTIRPLTCFPITFLSAAVRRIG